MIDNQAIIIEHN